MTLSIIAVIAVTGAALGIGTYGVKLARTTSDLFVASRAVSPWWNAAAISGEYLSAASFLGVSGLMLKFGASALWLPVGFTAGYLTLLLFVAAPLRRFGSYTIPDFAEARLPAPYMRLLAAGIVLLISGCYLVPQLKGAGVTLRAITDAPYWVGVALVSLIVALNVSLGGMRGVTYVQAFQYWVKVFAIAFPALLLLIHLGGLPARAALFGEEIPRADRAMVIELDAPRPVTFPDTGETRVVSRVELARGDAFPVAEGIDAQTGDEWSRPVAESGRGSPILIYSLLLATFLGTMGLPHILVRFYTNPDGSAARRTTVRVLGLLGVFYLFPAVYGLLGRAFTPELYVTGDTDSVVLRVPAAAWPGPMGDILAAIVAAGAFAAFMSTASGLLVSIAGTVSHDVVPGKARKRRTRFRIVSVVGMLPPALLALATPNVDISVLVGWAFALAASTFCPLLLLGVWWPRLTASGAAAGMLAGATVATGMIAAGLIGDVSQETAAGAILTQPAAVSVPIAFAAMIVISLRRPPQNVSAVMAALHVPEPVSP
ncbi:cation acetate symporter [Solirubrobacter sp. CPCC 204708]|uniref:Cation acetate symporter n=1 Tax=Solirubrobacter deserti TaxID=2282478 RepID=A0ABT4REN2_9ACTN|nr:cation acetate symporter [Solirubrobacter deserti]MBE2318537.1 cation acetate symporter [Solirubrobacter deserti]MDA0136995.1 cation acetate symporter [Solirubrobacter deserti]